VIGNMLSSHDNTRTRASKLLMPSRQEVFHPHSMSRTQELLEKVLCKPNAIARSTMSIHMVPTQHRVPLCEGGAPLCFPKGAISGWLWWLDRSCSSSELTRLSSNTQGGASSQLEHENNQLT
jgi:hypothetical protein